MENLALKTKFKSLLQKTGKLSFDFNGRNDGLGFSSPGESGRIPPEWAGMVGIGSPGGRRDEGVFVSNDNEMSKTDDEVLSSMEAAYFSELDGFDPTLFELEGLELKDEHPDLSLLLIDERRKTLLRQLKVVTKKAYAQILEKRPECVEEMTKVTALDDSLVDAIGACMNSRNSLEKARTSLAASSLGMLAAAKRRQRTSKLIHNLTIIATLQKTDVRLQELLSEGDYPAAIQLLLEVQQAVKTYNHFVAIKQLALKLQDTLELTEEQLDVALAKVCCNFNAEQYSKVQEAYCMLGKTQTSMDQLQMHVTSAVHNTAWNVVYGHAMLSNPAELDLSKRAYPDVCSMVADESLLPCLVDLCKALWLLMRSYKQIVYWHEVEGRGSSPEVDLDKHLERQYVQRKLLAGLSRIWQDVQTKVRLLVVAKEVGTRMKINDFLNLMHIIHKLIEFGHEFCGSDSDTLQESLKQQCSTYFRRYHRQRLEDLKMHLENEGWAICPVKPSFQLSQLKEYEEVRRAFTENGSPKKMVKYFGTPRREAASKNAELVSPFDSVLSDIAAAGSNEDEDLFVKADTTNFYQNDGDESDGDDECELSKASIVEDDEIELKKSSTHNSTSRKSRHGKRPSSSHRLPIVTNTSLMLLRLCGNYVHLMQMLRPIAGNIFEAMTKLLEYYAVVVHSFFAQDSQGDGLNYFGYGSTSPRLQALLTRIKTELIRSNSQIESEDLLRGLVELPEQPPALKEQLSEIESLNGLSEKFVAVESTIFIVEQFRQIRNIIDQLTQPEDREKIEGYFSQTLSVVEDLRRPVYWSVARTAFGFDSILQHISKVSWDIREVKSQHSQYVDFLLRELQIFCIRLQEVQETRMPISIEVQRTLWDLIVLAASFLFVEGFSMAKKCSNEGRALMQLDFRQFVLKLEAISDMKPLPHQDLVSNYVKAYYIPETELEEWVKHHTEYSSKQLLSLVNCVAYNNNKTKQKLDAIINELSTIKISIRK